VFTGNSEMLRLLCLNFYGKYNLRYRPNIAHKVLQITTLLQAKEARQKSTILSIDSAAQLIDGCAIDRSWWWDEIWWEQSHGCSTTSLKNDHATNSWRVHITASLLCKQLCMIGCLMKIRQVAQLWQRDSASSAISRKRG